MNISGNKQRLCIGAWFLAALLLMGLNVFQFLSLEEQPLVGYSQTVKVLQVKLEDFEKIGATGAFALKNRLNPLKVDSWFSSGSKTEDHPGAGKVPNLADIQESAESTLPRLSGILRALQPGGTLYYSAVLNGRVCRVKDKIDEFTVVKISPTSVVVRRGGHDWTLDSPTPYFSSDQGD